MVLGTRFEEMSKMGIKVVADFAIMDKEDIDLLFPADGTGEGKTKFDRKRFEKALQQSVPRWLLDSGGAAGGRPPAAAEPVPSPVVEAPRGNQSEAAEADAGPDALAQLLQRHMLHEYDAPMRRIGIRTPEDVLEMDDDDVRGMRLDKFSARRFGKLLEEMHPARGSGGGTDGGVGGSMPNFNASAPAANGMGGGMGLGLGSSAAWMPATRSGPTPEISMRKGTQQALAACTGAPMEAEQTLSSFYDHWHSTAHVVTAAQKRLNASQRLRHQARPPAGNNQDSEGKENN